MPKSPESFPRREDSDDYPFSKNFLEQEAEFGEKLNYRPFIFDALRQGDISGAVAYFRRAQEKGFEIDAKEVLQSELIMLITLEPPPNESPDQWGSILAPEEGDEPKARFNPGTVNTDNLTHFATELGVDFRVEEELQSAVEDRLRNEIGYMYREKGGESGHDRIKKFAESRGINLDYRSPAAMRAMQDNLENVGFGYIPDDIETPFGNTGGYDLSRYTEYVAERVREVVEFAKERGIQLDVKTAAQKNLHKLSKLKGNDRVDMGAKALLEVAHSEGAGLDASFDRLYLEITKGK